MSIRIAISAFAHRGTPRRRQALEHLAYSGGLMVVLLLLSGWVVRQAELVPPALYSSKIPWSVLGLADVFALAALAIGLFMLAPASVAATVAAERRAGTLDQLRTTPLDPLALLAGLVVGAPARIYLLCAGPLAFHVACGLTGIVAADTLAETLVVFLVGGVASALLGLVVALAPRQESGGAFIALGVAGLIGVSGLVAIALAYDPETVRWCYLHPAGALNASLLEHDGLWRRLAVSDWHLSRFEHGEYQVSLFMTPILSAVLTSVGACVLARAACRKLAAPHLPLFSKWQALGLFGLAAAGVILPLPVDQLSRYTAANAPFAFALILTPVMATVGLFATPSFEAWALALRRGRRLSPWHDDASPHLAVWAMVALAVGLMVVRFGARFPFGDFFERDRQVIATAWMVSVVLTLPSFMLFASTRYPTAAARWAFAAAVGAHLLMQLVSIAIVHSDGFRDDAAGTVAKLGALLAVVVPAWVWFRQRTLRRRTLDGSATA